MRSPRFRRAFRLALRRPDLIESEIDEEIAFHLQERIDALVDRGWSVDDARIEAARRFGDPITERAALSAAAHRREQRLGILEWIDTVRTDLRVAVRQLRHSPSFAFGTIAAFALGIGANATMFNVVDRLLLRPPPQIAGPGDVYTMQSQLRAVVSFPTFAALRDQLGTLAAVGAESFSWPLSVGRGDESRAAQTVFVDGGYFRVLGVHPALGRGFSDDDARLPNGQAVAVIGFGLWQRMFAGDASVIGRELVIEATRVRIVGVAPEGFNGVGTRPIDLWLPLTLASGLLPGVGPRWTSSGVWLDPIARVAPHVDARQVASRATTLRRAIERTQPRGDTSVIVTLQSILPSRAEHFSPEAKVASLLGAVSVLVLLIACSNVANLMLARAVRRRREIGIRMTLGVSNGRLIMQLLTDSMFLSTLGGIAAVAVTATGSALMRSVLLTDFAWDGALIDARTLAFIACTVVFAGLVTGLAPAFVVLRRFNLSQAIGEGRQSGGVHRHRIISALVVTQTVLSTMLLIGAVLFVRSLANVHAVPLGMDADHTVVVSLDSKTMGALGTRIDALFDDVRANISRVPGVSDVAIAEGVPQDWHLQVPISVPGRAAEPVAMQRAQYLSAVTSTYFSTVGTRIIQGRAFTPADDRASSEPVAVLSEELATRLWPAGGAIGRCARLGADSMPCLRIVGIAQDIHESVTGVAGSGLPYVYVPLQQGRRFVNGRVVVARIVGSPGTVIPLIRLAVQSAGHSMPAANIWSMRTRVDPQMRPWRLGATMFGVFGGLALVLAAIGLYSVIGYSVAQRAQEMGIRIALGARPTQILSLVGAQGAKLAGVGVAIAAVSATVIAPLVQPLLFQTSARSVSVYALVACAMFLVALAATLIPALRAAHVNPMSVIRSE